MSAHADRVKRREVRRLVGSDGVQIIEYHSGLLNNTILPALELHRRTLDAQQRILETQDAERKAFASSLWRRLHWLLRGR